MGRDEVAAALQRGELCSLLADVAAGTLDVDTFLDAYEGRRAAGWARWLVWFLVG